MLLVSILLFLSSLAFFIFAMVAFMIGVGGQFVEFLPSSFRDIVGFLAFIIGFFVLCFAILQFAVGLGNLRGRGWAWMVVIVVAILSLASNALVLLSGEPQAFMSVVIPIAVWGVVLWYYHTTPVKQYFGKT